MGKRTALQAAGERASSVKAKVTRQASGGLRRSGPMAGQVGSRSEYGGYGAGRSLASLTAGRSGGRAVTGWCDSGAGVRGCRVWTATAAGDGAAGGESGEGCPRKQARSTAGMCWSLECKRYDEEHDRNGRGDTASGVTGRER